MATLEELTQRYMVGSGDVTAPETVPLQFDDSKVTPLVDCADYNDALDAALATVGGGQDPAQNQAHFILIANWWLALSGGYFNPFPGSEAVGEVADRGDPRVYIPPYFLDGPPDLETGTGGTKKLLDILKAKARAGVDVRVLGWIPIAMADSALARQSGPISFRQISAHALQSIKDLRDEPAIGSKAIMNLIAHTAGGVHVKMVVIGNGTSAAGFTGGLDFVMTRWAHRYHFGPYLTESEPPTAKEYWHDIVAKVEGPAVRGLYEWFRAMWQENIGRTPRQMRFEGVTLPSFVQTQGTEPGALPPTPPLGAYPVADPTPPVGAHRVQSLRTAPVFRYAITNTMPENDPLSFAPDGLVEFKVALRKAIRNAQQYVYLEDQAFWSQEIMQWVGDAVEANPALRVIMLTGGPDPNDPTFPAAYLSNSMNEGFAKRLQASGKLDQVRFYTRFGEDYYHLVEITRVGGEVSPGVTEVELDALGPLRANVLSFRRFVLNNGDRTLLVVGNQEIADGEPIVANVRVVRGTPPALGYYEANFQPNMTIHSKTVLVDDAWALIGSTNVMRRSLYSDLEHAVSVVDPGGELVRAYRTALWMDHFRAPDAHAFDDIDAALHAWEPTWGTAGAAPPRPGFLVENPLPIQPDTLLTGNPKEMYDAWRDVDVRDTWGGLCPVREQQP